MVIAFFCNLIKNKRLRACLLLLSSAISCGIYANPLDSTLQISIKADNKTHIFELHDRKTNTFFLDKALHNASHKKITAAPSAKHFIGHKLDNKNKTNWARISKINNQWQGMIVIDDEYYQIYPQTTENHNSTKLLAHAITQESTDQPMGCGNEADHDAISNEEVNQLAILERKNFDSLALSSDPLDSKNQSAVSSRSLTQVSPRSFLSNMDIDFASACDKQLNGTCLVAEVEFAFDAYFQDVFGALAKDNAMALVNIVEGIYLNNFGIAFDKTSLHFIDNQQFSYTLDAASLLEDIFLKKQNNQIDFLQNSRSIFHLITGRDFNGSPLLSRTK